MGVCAVLRVAQVNQKKKKEASALAGVSWSLRHPTGAHGLFWKTFFFFWFSVCFPGAEKIKRKKNQNLVRRLLH